MSASLLTLCLSAFFSLAAVSPVFAAGKARKPQRRRPPAKQQAAAVSTPKPEPAPEPKKSSPIPAPDSGLASLGAELSQKEDGSLSVLGVLGETAASELPLRPGDRLTHLGRSEVKSRQDVALALKNAPPETRLSAVVLRGTEIEMPTADAPPHPVIFQRDSGDISVQERLFKEKRLHEVFAEADRRIKNTPLNLQIAAKQTVWVRFQKKIPANAQPGEILPAETVGPVVTDSNLDFFSLPIKTQLWAKVTKNSNLLFYKMKPAGGGFYSISARPVENPSAGADADSRLEIEFVEPVVLTEPLYYFQAGPGLWIKEHGKGFKISQIILGRAADQAGIRMEDGLAYIDGQQAEHFNMTEALTAIYGKPGSILKLGVKNSLTGKVETFNLRRGVSYKDGQETPLALPYSN